MPQPHRRFHADDPERRRWQDPEAILAGIGLKPGLTFVDVGCGGGFFTLPAARTAGEKGVVHGLDIDAGLIKELQEMAAREDLQNLKLTVGRAEDAVLCLECADIIFFGTVLHDFADPAAVLRNAAKMVKPSGKLVNLDWKKEVMAIGPPVQKRFAPEHAVSLIEAAGFRIETIKDSGPYHYLIIAVIHSSPP